MGKYDSRVFQHGTLGQLVPGLFEGTLSVSDLLLHGDFGIGTASGLDGEMILLDHVPYLFQSNGQVRILKGSEKVPFATVHFTQVKDALTVEKMTQAQLGQFILANYPYKNLFFAVKLTGEFEFVKTRAVAKQERPYKTLTQVADEQAVFEANNVSGTLIGYYAPALFHGMAAAGYHLHFLATDHTIGGHLLDFKVANAQVELQPFATVEQHFPDEDQEFLAADIDLSDLHAQIEQAEGQN
ncbi:acetolactate decarboxylase [Ligilactobacillus apodemi]|nr:acetolactate decarboxylase [Ligilactobacillus apodemi]MBD5068805.1 acetolactate decarboxylase [Lactobacillus sp.]MBD5069240.1 acetolactate decarboxylase [Lactobacillus sp.]MCR1901834.1 acetolactate decarboxylase [Ligilactobacillus apodemi]